MTFGTFFSNGDQLRVPLLGGTTWDIAQNSCHFQVEKTKTTPLKTNSSQLKIDHLKRNFHLPTINFQVLCLFKGGYIFSDSHCKATDKSTLEMCVASKASEEKQGDTMLVKIHQSDPKSAVQTPWRIFRSFSFCRWWFSGWLNLLDVSSKKYRLIGWLVVSD